MIRFYVYLLNSSLYPLISTLLMSSLEVGSYMCFPSPHTKLCFLLIIQSFCSLIPNDWLIHPLNITPNKPLEGSL